MASITSWSRLEPRTRRQDMRDGLRAAVADPLWMLGRQWQLDAFHGEDAATPVRARLRGQAGPLTRYRGAAGGPSVPYDARRLPLETLVERQPTWRGPRRNLRLAALAGLRFLDLVEDGASAAVRELYRGEYAFPVPTAAERKELDEATLRFLSVTADRVADGDALRAAFRPQPGDPVALPAVPPISGQGPRQAVLDAAIAWLDWYDALVSEPGQTDSAWVPARMEHRFAVAAPDGAGGEDVLTAAEYEGGTLDWYSFDLDPQAQSLGADADAGDVSDLTATVVPMPVRFGGMPAPRWWELEDSIVDFGKLDAGPPDLARLVFLEFATVYGNDFFLMPVELPMGVICRMRSLVVDDNFGGRTLIRPSRQTAAGGFGMFDLALASPGDGDTAPELLLLPPVLGPNLVSEPVEQVQLLRDEAANVAWAVERLVEGPTGEALNRFEAHQEHRRREEHASPAEPPTVHPRLVYRLATSVPPNWIPLVPVRDAGAVLLEVQAMLDPATGQAVPAHSRLLTEAQPLRIPEEEVPRAGARATSQWQHTRWVDGSTHVWSSRQKGVGRGEGSSGLRFDLLERST
jgi:hypothetical protein